MADIAATPAAHTDEAGEAEPSSEHLEPPKAASRSAVDRFEEQLLTLFDADAARVVARSVVDPADARRRLQNPSVVRVMGGVALRVIEVDVWMLMVAPYPANPRESGYRPLPIQQPTSTTPPFPRPEPGGRAAVVVRARDREEFARSQAHSAAWLVNTNSYTTDINDDGILRPLLLVATRVIHADNSADAWVLSAGDGSSRTASAHHLLGIKTEDVTYRYGADDRAMRALISELRSKADRFNAGVIAEQPPIRALTAPAMIVIGCDGGNISRGIAGYVGLQHVAPPKAWDDTGAIDARAEAALSEMEREGLSSPLRDWFTGHLRPADASALGLSPDFDDRSLLILHTIRQYQDAARRGVLAVDRDRSKVRQELLCAIAADLALRPCRHDISPTLKSRDLKVVRDALKEVYRRMWDARWECSGRNPEELREAALAESGDERVGPAARELFLLAAYHLLRLKTLRPLYYHHAKRLQESGYQARREPVTVLWDLVGTERGIHQLAQVVLDARSGVKPRKVAVDGSIIRAGVDAAPLDEDSLRKEFGESAPRETRPEPPDVTTPARELLTAKRQLTMAVTRAHTEARQIAAIGRPSPLIDEEGWDAHEVEFLRGQLGNVSDLLATWAYVWKQRQHADDVDDTADDDNGIDDDTDSHEGGPGGDEIGMSAPVLPQHLSPQAVDAGAPGGVGK